MVKLLETTYDASKKQTRKINEEEVNFPFPLVNSDTKMNGTFEKRTLNQEINLLVSLGFKLENIKIFKGNEEFIIDYSKSYIDVMNSLNSEVFIRHTFFEKISVDDNEKKLVEYRKIKAILNLEKDW